MSSKTVYKKLQSNTLRLLASIVVATTAVSATSIAFAAAPQIRTQAPGVYRLMLGDDEITVLSDGTAPRDETKIMKPSEEVAKALAADHETPPTEISINTFLINTGSKLILVDTGAGELFGPHSGGLLVQNLRAAGYRPEQVDAVLLTHIHADHSGGLSIGGKLVFPNALVYVDKRDPDFWLNAAAQAANPDKIGTFKSSHQTVDPVVLAGKLRPYDGATELFPGIHSVPAYGHTPGHSGYLIESEGQRLLLWGDTIHSTESQFADPDVAIEYDVNHDGAVASRKHLLSFAAKEGVLVGGAHISFPGLGHVKVQGDGYAWVPVPYGALQ